MRTDLDHLPPAKQRALKHVVRVLFEELERETALARPSPGRSAGVFSR